MSMTLFRPSRRSAQIAAPKRNSGLIDRARSFALPTPVAAVGLAAGATIAKRDERTQTRARVSRLFNAGQ